MARRIAACVVTAAFGVWLTAGAARAASDPIVHLDRTGTAAGETMLVRGEQWPDGATLIVELCGHGGLRGTVDCDIAGQRTAGVGPSGQFAVELNVELPPVPCPCVVRATDQSTQISATAPIAVAGIPTVPITAQDVPEPRMLELRGIRITGGQRFAELFGAGGRRVLEFTLVNTGPSAVDSPRVSIAWGRGAHPDGFVTPPITSRLEAGETQTLTVALSRPAMTLGSQTAVIEVAGLGTPITARATSSAYPWGLLAIALVVIQLGLLWIRNRVRRRITPPREPEPAELTAATLELTPAAPARVAAPVDEAPADLPVVIDLVEVDADQRSLEGEESLASHRGVNGSTSSSTLTGVPLVDEVTALRSQLADLRGRAQDALGRTREVSESCVIATEGRVRDIEERAREALRAAEASHTAAVEALAAARARADELLAQATSAAAGMLRDAAAGRDAAHVALHALRHDRDQLLDAAMEAVEEILSEIDEGAQEVAAGVDRRSISVDAPEVAPAANRAPHIGDLDGRLADAIARAFASAPGHDSSDD